MSSAEVSTWLEHNIAAVSATVEATREDVAAAERVLKNARQALRTAEKASELWSELSDYYSKGWPCHVLAFLRKNDKFVDYFSEAGADFSSLQSEAERMAQEQARNMPRLVERAATAANLPLDKSSRHPLYTTDGGYLELKIVDNDRTAVIRDYEGELRRMPADPEPTIEALVAEHERVFCREFDPVGYLGRVRAAYLALCEAQGLADGDSVVLRDVNDELKKRDKTHRADEFFFDMARLVRGPLVEVDGRYLDLQQTKDRRGVLLPGLADRGKLGFMVFREVRDDSR